MFFKIESICTLRAACEVWIASYLHRFLKQVFERPDFTWSQKLKLVLFIQFGEFLRILFPSYKDISVAFRVIFAIWITRKFEFWTFWGNSQKSILLTGPRHLVAHVWTQSQTSFYYQNCNSVLVAFQIWTSSHNSLSVIN